jgi:hypothetical protein
MSKDALIKAEVAAYLLAGDVARLAADIAKVSRERGDVFAKNARLNIQSMRASLSEIEFMLKTEEENNV